MPQYISLLRGVNVTGYNKVPMATLKTLYESLGLTSVTTYIQSGNVVFDAEESCPEELRIALERAIKRSFGFDISVLLRQTRDLKRIIRKSPFDGKNGVAQDLLYVTFLEAKPQATLVKALSGLPLKTKDRYCLAGKEIYLHCPGGYGKTILSNTFFEKHLKLRATTRNWKTVHALVALAGTVSD